MNYQKESSKSWFVTLLFSIFLGYLGIHRFYTGKYVTAILWLFTGGLFGIGYIIDIVLIGTFRFKDAQGRLINK